MKSFQHYNPILISRSRELRKNSTLSEVLLWEKIKGRQLLGYKFRRQTPVAGFIIDFYCKELHLGIEVDGRSHDFKMDYDISREASLKKIDILLLRFNDLDIKKDIITVLQRIVDWIDANPPLPRPSGDSKYKI